MSDKSIKNTQKENKILTRTEHYQRIEEVNGKYQKKIKNAKIRVIISIAILIIGIIATWTFFTQGWDFYDDTATKEVLDFSYMLDRLLSFVGLMGIVQFLVFGLGSVAQISKFKRYRDIAIQNLEDIKKEKMLTGTYDASK